MTKPPFDLKCEYLINPIGIDRKIPRFSWILTHDERNQYQSAYRIIVSSDEISSMNEKGDMWDSGRIKSDKQINVNYNGKPLESDRSYFWRIKWWDKNDTESDFSKIQKFTTGLFEDSDWKAEWISRKEFIDRKTRRQFQYKSGRRTLVGRLREVHAVYLRKEFTIIKEVKSAIVYVCGLGYYEFRLNGKKVGNRILEPAQTDYKKIALYSTYVITEYLQSKNAIGVILGNGRCIELFGYDFPKLILQINIKYFDGSSEIICTDNSWKVSNGPILENGIYHGEIYDARLEMPRWDEHDFDDLNWGTAVEVNGHNLESQMMQPIQITKILKPKELISPKPGIYMYDFGQNFTGFVRLKVCGPQGTQVKLRFSEIVFEDGTLNTATNGQAPVTDIYILKGDGEEIFEPHFTYHGFRYVELTGFPGVPSLENLDGLFFHSNVPIVGDFFCSNELINQIHTSIIWGQLSNLMSIPTDCPQRDERHGWMGDAQVTIEEAIFNFDMARFFTKYLRDIKVCQRANGSISDVVPPYWKLYPADPGWGTAYITITWYLYWYYNDIQLIEEHYDSLKKYVNFLSSIAKENLVLMGKYGDWCPPRSIVSRKTPVELTSSWYYYHDTLYISKIAKILGKHDDHDFYKTKAEEIKIAFNNRFLKGVYDVVKLSPPDQTISQTSNILPLYLDLVPERKRRYVLKSLVKAIHDEYDYHIDTGIIGTRYIFDTLTENGFPDVVYKMINQKSFPGYGYMIQEGATTLWERWEKLEGGGMNSHNHIMLGSVDTWFFKTLGGIHSLEPGFKTIKIKPYIPSDMSYVRAKLNTLKGLIYTAWEKTAKFFKITIVIPVGCTSEVWVPLVNDHVLIKEGETILWREGNPLDTEKSIEYSGKKDRFVIFKIGSGHYEFIVHRLDTSNNIPRNQKNYNLLKDSIPSFSKD